MELRVLRYFLTVTREENITRAADILHITQPTLSRQLTQLEDELGTLLFTRGKRKIVLTEAGMLLRRRAEELVELADKTEQELGSPARELSGTIAIGSGETRAANILPRLLGIFREQHPLVHYDLISGNADQMKEQLDLGLMDAAILMEPVNLDKYEFLRLPDMDRWGVLMPAGAPLAERESVSLEDLKGIPLLTSRRASVRKELADWFGEEFDRLDFFATHNLIRNAALLVEHGLGYAVTIEGAVDIYDKNRVRFLPFAPEFPCRAVLAWKKYQTVSPAVSAFLECARTLIRQQRS